MVDEGVLRGAAKLLPAPLGPHLLFKRLPVPVWFAQFRQFKAKTRIPLNPAVLAGKDVSFSRHTELRARTIALFNEQSHRDLSSFYWRDPIFGRLTV